MEAMRTKDRIFLAVLVPLALAAAYVYFWRADARRNAEALEREGETLVEVEDFPVERARAAKRLEGARNELAAEKKIPMPTAKVKATAEDSAAARERAVLEVFRTSGLSVTSSGDAESANGTLADVLMRTGARPNPVCRRYSIEGRYPQMCEALRSFAAREMAVIPERVEMVRPGSWVIVLWL